MEICSKLNENGSASDKKTSKTTALREINFSKFCEMAQRMLMLFGSSYKWTDVQCE